MLAVAQMLVVVITNVIIIAMCSRERFCGPGLGGLDCLNITSLLKPLESTLVR